MRRATVASTLSSATVAALEKHSTSSLYAPGQTQHFDVGPRQPLVPPLQVIPQPPLASRQSVVSAWEDEAEEEGVAQPLSLTAEGITSLNQLVFSSLQSPYCICEIVKGGLRSAANSSHQEQMTLAWKEEFVAVGCHMGDSLSFRVYDDMRQLGEPDVLIGTALLDSSEFLPDGFDGDVQLMNAGNGVVLLRLTITLMGLHDTEVPERIDWAGDDESLRSSPYIVEGALSLQGDDQSLRASWPEEGVLCLQGDDQSLSPQGMAVEGGTSASSGPNVTRRRYLTPDHPGMSSSLRVRPRAKSVSWVSRRSCSRRADERRAQITQQLREQEESRQHQRRAMPSRNALDPATVAPRCSIATRAGERLHEDAWRLRRKLQDERDNKERAEALELKKLQPVGNKSQNGVQRSHDLYLDAQCRQRNLEEKRKAKYQRAQEEEDHLLAIGRGDGHPGEKIHAVEHSERLYRMHKEHLQKMARLREEKSLQLQADLAPKSIRRPLVSATAETSSPTASTCGSASEARSPKTLASSADWILASAVSAIHNRCGQESVPDLGNLKELSEPLAAISDLYQKAKIEAGVSCATLCKRLSMRRLNEHLVREDVIAEKMAEPDPFRQMEEKLEDLLDTAARAQGVLQRLVAPESSDDWPVGATCDRPLDGLATFGYNPGPKSRLAAGIKARVLYGPTEGRQRHRHLLDLARLSLVFSNCEVLEAGLVELLSRCPDVLQVRNFFRSPDRLGARYIEVLLVVYVPKGEDGAMHPHVCELRFEELNYFQANAAARDHLNDFVTRLRHRVDHQRVDGDALVYLVLSVLASPPESQTLKRFRRSLIKSQGSLVGAWRSFGNSRLTTFGRFRQMCQSMSFEEHVTDLWEELDAGRSGCISLFEMDPEAVSLLIRLRARLLANVNKTGEQDLESLLPKVLSFMAFESSTRATTKCLDQKQFRNRIKPLGFRDAQIDRMFAYLDSINVIHKRHIKTSFAQGGGYVTAAEITWLWRLSDIVDFDAIALAPQRSVPTGQQKKGMSEEELLEPEDADVNEWAAKWVRRRSSGSLNQAATEEGLSASRRESSASSFSCAASVEQSSGPKLRPWELPPEDEQPAALSKRKTGTGETVAAIYSAAAWRLQRAEQQEKPVSPEASRGNAQEDQLPGQSARVDCHPHELVKFDDSTRWICDGACASCIRRTAGIEVRWRCAQCDYDLCRACVNVHQLQDAQREEQQPSLIRRKTGTTETVRLAYLSSAQRLNADLEEQEANSGLSRRKTGTTETVRLAYLSSAQRLKAELEEQEERLTSMQNSNAHRETRTSLRTPPLNLQALPIAEDDCSSSAVTESSTRSTSGCAEIRHDVY